jgi:hypothetical protein
MMPARTAVQSGSPIRTFVEARLDRRAYCTPLRASCQDPAIYGHVNARLELKFRLNAEVG